MNAAVVGSEAWTESFKRLVKMASKRTIVGNRARAFLFNQCGVAITAEACPAIQIDHSPLPYWKNRAVVGVANDQ